MHYLDLADLYAHRGHILVDAVGLAFKPPLKETACKLSFSPNAAQFHDYRVYLSS